MKNWKEWELAVFSIAVDKRHEGDEVEEFQGLAIFIDQRTAAFLAHCELDYEDEPCGVFSLREKSCERK